MPASFKAKSKALSPETLPIAFPPVTKKALGITLFASFNEHSQPFL
jgi:hypothetical protein